MKSLSLMANYKMVQITISKSKRLDFDIMSKIRQQMPDFVFSIIVPGTDSP